MRDKTEINENRPICIMLPEQDSLFLILHPIGQLFIWFKSEQIMTPCKSQLSSLYLGIYLWRLFFNIFQYAMFDTDYK